MSKLTKELSDAAKSAPVGRRSFLKGVAAGAAALAASATAEAAVPATAGAKPPIGLPSAQAAAAERGDLPREIDVETVDRPGSDFMVDVLKAIGFEYIAANPGSSFRSLHESIINYGGNQSPELLTCLHEESSVAMADGYYKIEGKPMAVMAHSNVGLQHAAMTLYNSYAGRVPLFLILGNNLDATQRRPGVEWSHSAQDVAAMARDFTKWDDTPISLPHFAESAMRAYKIAMTPPMGPVILVADAELQERGVPPDLKIHIPKLTLASPPAGEQGAVNEVARLLVNAEYPVIVTDRGVRTPEGLKLLIELAETVQAPVTCGGESGAKFPSRHPLSLGPGGGTIRTADFVLALDALDIWGTLHMYRDQAERSSKSNLKEGAKVATITATDLSIRSNNQDFQRYAEVDIAIAADPEATLPSLIEACKKLITPERQTGLQARGKRIAEQHNHELEGVRLNASYGWDASPISKQRMVMEVWNQIKGKDWSLVGGIMPRLWDVTKFYQVIDGPGAFGMGHVAPEAVGAALANRKYGRLSVCLQDDGDLMYAPGVLWTAAHHRIPMLIVVNNNRAYHQETMHIQRMANRHQRGITNAGIGTSLSNPNIDYATLGRSMGLHGEGPIANPNDLGLALARAIATVERGETAIVDVVTQPR